MHMQVIIMNLNNILKTAYLKTALSAKALPPTKDKLKKNLQKTLYATAPSSFQ